MLLFLLPFFLDMHLVFFWFYVASPSVEVGFVTARKNRKRDFSHGSGLRRNMQLQLNNIRNEYILWFVFLPRVYYFLSHAVPFGFCVQTRQPHQLFISAVTSKWDRIIPVLPHTVYFVSNHVAIVSILYSKQIPSLFVTFCASKTGTSVYCCFRKNSENQCLFHCLVVYSYIVIFENWFYGLSVFGIFSSENWLFLRHIKSFHHSSRPICSIFD